MSATGVRIITPLLVTARTSSPSSTMSVPTTGPFSSVSLMPITPRPARCLQGNSSTGVRLPYPSSVTCSRAAPGRVRAQPTTRSPSCLNFRPSTPAAARPMARTSDSAKRMVWPSREDSITSWRPLVGMTATSSSSSFSLTAMSPARSERS